MNKPKLIAEIGCNHGGSFDEAIKMIDIASSYCNVDAVKFQKRHIPSVLTQSERTTPHPVPHNSYGITYGEHREALEFTVEEHEGLRDYAHNVKIGYGCSVWDMQSMEDIIGVGPDFIKVPSACNTNFAMIEALAKNYMGDIHISMGMTTREEYAMIIECAKKTGRINDFVFYACTSAYPVDFEDVKLNAVQYMHRFIRGAGGIGFSGHHKGIAIDVAAYALGAEYIERHFTLDRTLKGTDHAASLEPDGMRKLARNLDETYMSMGLRGKDILNCEKDARKKLRWDRHENA